jgi:hypothetical protein
LRPDRYREPGILPSQDNRQTIRAESDRKDAVEENAPIALFVRIQRSFMIIGYCERNIAEAFQQLRDIQHPQLRPIRGRERATWGHKQYS